MANYLVLNQPQPFVGLGTLTYNVPSTGAGLYSVIFSVTVPVGITGNVAGSGYGLGSGTGGGAEGFTGGDLGTGHGGVGQGFGAANGYQQPPSYGSNQVAGVTTSSGLTVVVKDGGSTLFTAPTITATQGAYQFKYTFQAANSDAITVVLSSSTLSDEGLNGLVSTTTIQQGA
jgi:hypothetical protein